MLSFYLLVYRYFRKRWIQPPISKQGLKENK
jgi:hypothetical protein